MRIRHLIILGIALCAVNTFGQKKVIDITACNDWERLKEVDGKSCLLSADGNYILFKKVSESLGEVTILKNINTGRERKFPATSEERSFEKGRMFAFQLGRDSLAIFDTEKEIYSYLTGIKHYEVFQSKNDEKIACLTESAGIKSLIIFDRNGKRIKCLPNVSKYWLHKHGKGLLANGPNGFIYIDLSTFKQSILTKNQNIEDAAFSDSGNEVVYILKVTHGYCLRYTNVLTGDARLLLEPSSDFLKDKWQLEPSGLSFDNKYRNVFFRIAKDINNLERQFPSVGTKDVNVWSYKDLYLQDKQLNNRRQIKSFTAMINVQDRVPIQLESDTLRLELIGNSNKYFVLTTQVNENEFYWNMEKKRMYLFSAITGEKRLIKESTFPGFNFISISPNNEFLVWFDGQDGNYYSYNTVNHTVSNMSRFRDDSLRDLNQRAKSAGLIFQGYSQNGHYWATNSTTLTVHARNDIWQLDPLGGRKPVNLTNAYGDSHNLQLKIVEQENVPFQINYKEYLIWAFNNRTKQNGFWKINAAKPADPVKLVMSDDAYYFIPTSPIVPLNSAEDPTGFKPVKASKSNVFVVRRMNSSSAPNLFSTTDFKEFKLLSDIRINEAYVNVRSKLIRYTLSDGQSAEGILHLPENLDESKTYPIIFNYYERRSEGLNFHRSPALSGHNINIPWYVSRGYLVFEPDFYYNRGETAESVIGAVRASIVELSKLPYVDTAKMGAQGQSFGGYESNVLAIQTNLFKAVCAMAGPVNLITEYGSMRPGGFNNQSAEDVGQRNLGVFPWDNPDVFIKNSPNFHIRKANTPLLLVHNKGDGAILFSHALELYLGMRRLNKKVWMLEYDREGHDITESQNKLDFTIRMQQFFDHYLKGEPASKWMTQGVPAHGKGIDSGLELDKVIKTPGEGIARPVAPGKIF